MVTDALLNIAYSVLNGFLDLVPSVGIEWGSGDFGTLMTVANMVFPISEIFGVLRVMVAAATAAFGLWVMLKVIDWVTNVIP